MSLLVGHRETLSRIPNPLPPVTLLMGPEGVGKSIAARILAYGTGVKDSDYQRIESLTKPAAREVAEHHSRHPLESAVRVSVIDLTIATPEASHAMLALLESPPPYSRFILHSDTTPFLTIRSRCFILNFGHLTEEEVAQVLEQQKVPEHVIPDAARLSQGRVSVALEHARNYTVRQHVQKILMAVAKQDAVELEKALLLATERVGREDGEALAARRSMVATLLARALRSSLGTPNHPLKFIPAHVRMDAMDVLEKETSRPMLRVRSGVWRLIGEI